MKNNDNTIIRAIGDPDDFDAIKLMCESRLPRSLGRAWKKGSGYDPYTVSWLSAAGLILLSVLELVLVLGGYWISKSEIGDSHPLRQFLVCAVVLIITIGLIMCILKLIIWEGECTGSFSKAVYWILFFDPSSKVDLDMTVKLYSFRHTFHFWIRQEVLKVLLAELNEDEQAAEIHRESLNGLFHGALGFGFIKEPSKGKEPFFDEVENTADYQQALKNHLWDLQQTKLFH
jgi:hypothetical protein